MNHIVLRCLVRANNRKVEEKIIAEPKNLFNARTGQMRFEKMATAGTASGAVVAEHTSSYRVKFNRKEFLELVEIARPRIIYHRKRMHFFAFDGFVMYTFECEDRDLLDKKVMHAIEFSNLPWSE